MIRDPVADRELVAETKRVLFGASEAAGDQAGAGLAVRRIGVAEENTWMLRSHPEG